MPAPYDLFDYSYFWERRKFEDRCERIALKKIFTQVKKKETLLDIGGGFGRLATLYGSIFKSCTILDPSEKLLEIGKNSLRDYRNIIFKRGSLPFLPFTSSSFDTVLMVRVIHHLSAPSSAMKEIKRVLRPGGYFILEMANKIHILARIRAGLRGDFSFAQDLTPTEGRSKKSIEEKKITFVNHHPKKIIELLSEAGFTVLTILSVSNFRHQFIKKIFPQKFLLVLEEILQRPLGKIFFGPSIFILARKN